MKKDTHPQYQDITFTCACGAKFVAGSTIQKDFKTEICSNCHPFYTGKQKLVDTSGRVEKFVAKRKKAAEGKTKDDSRWLDKNGNHVSTGNFDKNVYYWADVEGPKDEPYLNQHVFNGKYSYFGNLLTKKLTKIINVPVFKNTGNGISMATKNIGYGAICNTGRLHRPLFFDVCTEVFAFPVIRDKLVLNITDGLRAQYDGGPIPVAKFTYLFNTLFFATDPFALDMICHRIIVAKRKDMKVTVNEHPRYTEYLRYAERLGLGIVNQEKIEHGGDDYQIT